MAHQFPFAPPTTPVGEVVARVEREHEATAVSAYKAVLKRVVDSRPSGTRQRLANALGKKRSFISQIVSPAYSVPIPAVHLDTIFEVCHFTDTEKSEFLTAYARAHAGRRRMGRKPAGYRTLEMSMPDLGDAVRNRRLEQAIAAVALRLACFLGKSER